MSLTGGPFTNKRPAIVPYEDCFLDLGNKCASSRFVHEGRGGYVRGESFEGISRDGSLSLIYISLIALYTGWFYPRDFRFPSLFEFAQCIRPIQSIGTIIIPARIDRALE